MGPLSEWLGDRDVATFVAEHLGKTPFAAPRGARAAIETCTWQQLDALLRAGPPDVLVVAAGRELGWPAPRSLAELRALFRLGAGVAIRQPEKVFASLRALADDFAQDLPGEQRVIVFATPGATNGFGWHYDAEDVFVVQTAGDKEYYMRRNTVCPPAGRRVEPNFDLYSPETSPLLSCRLIAGDWLYIPRGFWHLARAREDSLSISIGVFPDQL